MKTHKLRGLTVLAITCGLALPATGAILVDYNHDDGQAGGNLNQPNTIQTGVELGGGLGADSLRRITLADNSPDPWSSTAGDYVGPAYSIVWEGIELNGTGAWDSRDSNPLSIRYQTNGTGQAGNFHLAVFFEASSATLDATSSFFAQIQRSESVGTLRWLVRDGSTFYVSDATLSGGSNTLDNGAGLLTTNWAVHDLATTANFDADNASFSTLSTAFTDLNAFGLIADKDSLTATRHWFEMQDFTVDAVPVPEPSTYAILAGFAVLFTVVWLSPSISYQNENYPSE